MPQQPDLGDAEVVAALFEEAAEANLSCSLRRGSAEHLGKRGHLVMTGDLHDHGVNLMRIMKLADLDAGPDRHVVLHEVIHGPNRVNGRDLSVRTLARVAALKVRYPDQVHLLQSNHELAQMLNSGIFKNGVDAVAVFNEGLEYIYGADVDQVRAAMSRFIRSYPLALRCENGVFCCHSLPSPRQMEGFDPDVVEREPTDEDLSRGGAAYVMVWGRLQTQEQADELAARWGAKIFVMGHQPVEMGCDARGERMLILGSDNNHGAVLEIDLAKRYDLDGLLRQVIPLVSVMP